MKTNPVVSVPLPASRDQVAARAREIWLSRGSPEGQDVEIWLLAERELAVPSVSPSQPSPTLSAAKKAGKASRKNMRPPTEGSPEVIDVGELEDRLKRFGEPAQRSPTALDLS